ncbi:MAG: cysteine synthase family protein [Saprospiraceae bacterium]|nr:cysteine synthase family protein [Saprospiraceae bacterium]
MTYNQQIPVKTYYDSILQSIGHTPMIRLNAIVADLPCTVLAKVESFNPGLSAKDRIALLMIEKAERSGKLMPGGTVIESTSGNTGFSVAMVCAVKGYKCILTAPSKISEEKQMALKAMGAELKVCPANAKPDDPESYYSVAKQLNADIPNSFYINQYYNTDNSLAHYRTTGPEIWQQSGGNITHYFAACGTGGTLTGTARFLKRKKPGIQIIGVDAYGSVLKKYHETGEFDENEIYPYKLEAVGKNIIPANVDFDLVDEFVKVRDGDAAFRARELATTEGILAGYSSGAALQGVFEYADRLRPEDVVVVLFSDHGSKYFQKIFNDDWMREQGFME